MGVYASVCFQRPALRKSDHRIYSEDPVWMKAMSGAMIGENRQLVADEPVGFEK